MSLMRKNSDMEVPTVFCIPCNKYITTQRRLLYARTNSKLLSKIQLTFLDPFKNGCGAPCAVNNSAPRLKRRMCKIQQGEFAEIFFGRCVVGFGGFDLRCEKAEVFMSDLCLPLVTSFMPTNSLKLRRMVFL